MKKFKENFKKHWKLSLVLFVLLLGVVGATLWFTLGSNRTSNESTNTYTAYVQSEKGTALEKVYVMLCAEDGTEITWLPYVTNTSGKVQFVEGIEEGCYVKVVGVPIGYKLDESVKYNFDSFGNVKITLAEDDSVYIAQIGDTKFMSLSSAIGVANASSEDVIIELMADVVMNTGTLKNGYGKNITIKGNGHTITTEGGNNSFLVNQAEGVVAFENVNIKHKNTGATFQVNGLTTLSLTDVAIDATGGSAYNYALINTLAVDGTTTLNLTRVDVKMAVQTPAKANEAGIIRTGNTSGTKTVDINMVDCNFDTEGATGRQCIVVMKNTVANIKATNCSFKAGDSPAIWAAEQSKMQTLVMNNSKAVSTISPSSATPIKGYAAMIGNTYYLTFAHAAEVAAKAKSDVTIKAVADVTMKTCTIKNENGKLITIDGNGKTITTSGGSNAFVLESKVAFTNLRVNHKNTGSVFQMTSPTNLTATNVNINATEGKTYSYALVNVNTKGDSTIDFTNVNVVMAVDSKGSDSYSTVIRTGNEKEDNKPQTKNVAITLKNCNFDTTKATGRTGITIVPNTTATVTLENTKITTKDTFAIRSNHQEIIWKNADTKLTSLDPIYQTYPVEYYLAKIGDVFYTLKQAVKVANAATVDTQINLLYEDLKEDAAYDIGTLKINNTAGKLVTLNGNGKKLKTSGSVNAIQVANKVKLTDMNINHQASGSAIHVVNIATVDVSDVTINATSGKAYDYALVNILLNEPGAMDRANKGEVTTLNMTDVDITMEVKGRGKGDNAIIRTGNNSSAKKKTVDINLKDCDFNTEKATGRSGILIMQGTIANVDLKTTNIKTLDAPAVWLKESQLQTMITDDNTTFSSIDEEAKAKAAKEAGKSYVKQTVKGYDAVIGEHVYHSALTQAARSVEDGGTIKLLQNVSCGWVTVAKSCTIDGDGYKITTNAGNADDKFLFVIQKEAKDVTIKNMDIVHKRRGMVVRHDIPGNLTMSDVNIDATQTPVSNEYALFNLLGENGTTNLVWNNVTVDMDATEKGKDSNASIIRTGNEDDKTVNMTLTDCVLDATDATGRHGIVVVNKTTANISLDNTTIKTGNVSAIKANTGAKGEATVSQSSELICGKKADEQEGYKVKLNDTWMISYDQSFWTKLQNVTEDVSVTIPTGSEISLDTAVAIQSNNHTITVNGTLPANVTIASGATCVSGTTTYYATFANAMKNAREANVDSVITLFDNVSLSSNVIISNGKGKSITIDGNNKQYTITTKATNTLCVEHNGTVTLKDLKLKHEAKQGTVMVKETSVLNLQNVDIDAKNIAGYQFGLINMFGKDNVPKNMTLNMTGVTVDMDGTTPSGTDNAIVRTGNGGGAGEKNVTINMTNCSLNTGSATNLHGIRIQSTTTADVTLTNTNITTKNVAPIYNGSTTSTVDRTGGTFTCTDGNVKVGDKFYATLQAALDAVKSATEAKTIDICSDITDEQLGVKSSTSNGVTQCYNVIENSKGKKITLDGNWCSMSITNTNAQNALRVKSETELKEFTMNYSGKQCAVRMEESITATTLTLTNVDIYATTATGGDYLKWGIINILTKTGTSTLNLVNTDVVVSAPVLDSGSTCVIRGGNDNHSKTVKINLTNSHLDAKASKGRLGIWLPNKAAAEITMTDSTIEVDKTTNSSCNAVVSNCTDSTITRTLTLNGTTSLKVTTANGFLAHEDAVKNISLTDNAEQVQVFSVRKNEESKETKTLILEVPANLYDKLVEVLKSFGETWGWNIGL